jgi:hypothetical protein
MNEKLSIFTLAIIKIIFIIHSYEYYYIESNICNSSNLRIVKYIKVKEQVGSSSNVSDLYSKDAWFKPRSGYQLL